MQRELLPLLPPRRGNKTHLLNSLLILGADMIAVPKRKKHRDLHSLLEI